ncbi:MAG: hypothetical protein QXN68_00400 [Thermoplasmata archaeon]
MIKQGIRNEDELISDWNDTVLTIEKEFGIVIDKEYPVLKLFAQAEYLKKIYSKNDTR